MKHYKKTFTRDNGLIIQEVWSYAFGKDVKNAVGEKSPFEPVNIYYVNDGVSEIWDCVEAHDWFMNKILELNNKNSEFFDKCMEEYGLLLKKLEDYKIKGLFDSVEELKEFIEFLRRGSELFVVMYYSAINDKMPEEIYKRANKMRVEDVFYDECEKIIKRSIVKLFPHTKDCELVVTINDLDSIPIRDILEKRMENSVFIPGVVFEIINLKDYLKEHSDYVFLFDKISKETQEKGIIRGSIAFKGYAKGIVRILKRKIQVSELKEGEIIVSPMTTPDFIPAMEKAAAFITDEGGTLCHAAIVARELEKPCIIGTKVASQVLKNGDLVEVDANKGIVRKL